MVDINGTANDDILEDLNSSDNLIGGSGNDTITVSAIDDSHDRVNPGTGDNLVTFLDGTGSGHVNLFNSGGNDTIEGSASDQTTVYLYFGTADATATVDLGAGTIVTDNRTVEFSEVNELRLYNGGTLIPGVNVDMRGYVHSSENIFILFTSYGTDVVQMGEYEAYVYLGHDDDMLIVNATTSTWDYSAVDGGEGTDTIDFSDVSGAVQMILWTGRATQSSSTLEVRNMETFIGTNFGDTMDATGETQNITFRGEGGADTLTGGHGNDTLDGGFSQDSLDGGDGDDHLTGGYGDDTIIGGDGMDTAYYTGFGGGITVSLVTSGGQYTGAGGTDDLQGIENLVGGDFNDRFVGSTSDNILQLGAGSNTGIGLGGDDTILGGSGVDNIQGGAGEDFLRGYGGRDVLDGGNDDDFLAGGSGNDQLRGGTGSDTLEGGEGRDILIGGPVSGRTFPGDGETDYFVFNDPSESPVGAGRDIIRDFEVGIDQIVLVDMVAGMDFIGTDAFLGPKGGGGGEVRYSHAGSFTIVQADLDSDGTADFEIRLDGTLTLSANDFLLE